MHNLGALQSNKGLLESAIASGLIENPNKGKPMKQPIVTLALLAATQAFAWQPIFQEHQAVEINNTAFKNLPIDLWGSGSFTGTPTLNFTDYNGDGLNDLVVGFFDKGAIFVAENIGSEGAPQFDDYKFLTNDDRDTTFAESI